MQRRAYHPADSSGAYVDERDPPAGREPMLFAHVPECRVQRVRGPGWKELTGLCELGVNAFGDLSGGPVIHRPEGGDDVPVTV